MKDKIFGQLRYDFLQLGWVMAIWAAWILLDAVVGWQRWHGSAGRDWHHLIAYFSSAAIPLIGATLVLVLAPSLAFGHSPWRSDAFWRTRPLSVRHLLWTRIGFLLAFVFGVPLAIRFAVQTLSGIEPGLAFSNAFGYSLSFLVGAAGLWGLAMLFRGWRLLLVAVFALILLHWLRIHFWFYLLLHRLRSDKESHRSLPEDVPDGLLESRFLVAGVLLFAAGAISGGILLQRRNRVIGSGALVVSVAVAFAVLLMWSVNLFPAKNLGTVRSTAPVWTEGPPRGGAVAEGNLIWNQDEVPEENWLGLMEISTVYPLDSGPPSTWRLRTIGHPLGMGLSVQRALEGLGIRACPGPQEDRVPREGSVSFQAISTWWDRPSPWVVSGEVQAHLFRHEIAGSIPVKPGARFLKDGNLVAITGVRWEHPLKENEEAFLSIELVTDRLRTWFSGNEYWRTTPSSDPFHQWQLALVFPEAAAGSNSGGSLFKHLGDIPETGFLEGGARIRVPVSDPANPESPPLISKDDLEECRLFILRPVYRETMVAPFSGGGER